MIRYEILINNDSYQIIAGFLFLNDDDGKWYLTTKNPKVLDYYGGKCGIVNMTFNPDWIYNKEEN